MPRQTEPNANNALGDILRGMMPGCEVRSENTQTFIDHPGRHADVLIVAPGRSPVVVEVEYEPAVEAEKDASERLGLRVKGAPRTVEAAIALRYPKTVEDAYDLRLAQARIHRRTALGTALEEARGCSCESGIMVLEQKPAGKQGAPNRCCHRTNPTVSASSLTTTAW